MGDDAAIAPLAGRARPFSAYLRQRFAQVANPAIDHLRERLVMSVATLIGPRVDMLAADGPLPRLTALPGFLLYPSGLESSSPLRLDATFTGEEGLGRALDRIVVLAEGAVAAGTEPSASPTGTPGVSARRCRDPRSLGRAHATRRDGPAHALFAARGVGRAARHARDRMSSRLRRGRHLPAARIETVAQLALRTTASAATGRRRTRRNGACSRRSRRAS